VAEHCRPAGVGIGQIEGQQARGGITAAAGGNQLDARRHVLAQGLAELAGGAGEQHFHANTSPAARAWARLGAAASFSASSGSRPPSCSRG
jgi:hypothetical protein